MATLFTRRESKYWWCSFKDPHGNKVRKSTGVPAEQALKEKAQLAANNLELSVWDDWHPNKKEEFAYLFDELFARWIEETDPGPGELYPIKNLMGYFGSMDMADVTGSAVNGYIQHRRSAGVTDSTIRRELGTFSSAINYAILQWEWPITNTVEKRRPKPGKHRIRFFTLSEYNQLKRAAQCDPTILDFLEISVNTGLRKMELLSCPISRVDLRHSVMYLNPDDQKNREYSTVPLNQTAKKAIIRRITWVKQHRPESEYLFPGQVVGHREDIKRAWAAMCKRANVTNARPHDCRHTFATWLAQSGKVPLHMVKEAMRHSSITVTEKYAHLIPKNVEISVNVLDEHSMGHSGKITSFNPEEIIEKYQQKQ